ncbi:MAG: 50S ribosomal protein L25, partial [Bdellovibrionales bacterium]
MTQVTSLAAELRDRETKGTARAIRRQGKVPGVIYGAKQSPVTVSVESNLLARQLEKPGFFIRLVDLEVEGKKHRVLPRDVQYDPV